MFQQRYRRQSRRGALLFLIAFCVLFLLIFSAFIVNLAYMQLVDTQLRSATDSATRAAAESLLRGGSTAEAREAAKSVALANNVAGQPLALSDEDIEFGWAEAGVQGRVAFSTGGSEINAVRILGDRTKNSADGSVSLLFQGFLDSTHFETTRIATARIQDRDFCFVLDRSGSMNSRDAAGQERGKKMTRMEALKFACGVFVDVLNETPGHEQLGAASYSSRATVDRELTFDYSIILKDVDGLIPIGMTNIGEGIDRGRDILMNPATARGVAKPVMVVLTDGVHNQSRDPVLAATEAMAMIPDLEIHTITFSDFADVSRMQEVARVGEGRHHHARDLSELAAVFADIARTAGTSMVE